MYRLTITRHQRDRYGMDRAQLIASNVYTRWSQALAHALGALIAFASEVGGLDETNAEYGEWHGALESMRLAPPQEPRTFTDPAGTVYSITRED